MTKKISRFLNNYNLHAVEFNHIDSYEIVFKNEIYSVNVTDAIVLVGLNKLTVAIAADLVLSSTESYSIVIYKNNISMATLQLKPVKIDLFKNNDVIHFFEITGSQVAGRYFFKYPDILFLFLKNFTNKKSKSFVLPAKIIFSLCAFYVKPKPTYVLCTEDRFEADIFPIDIGGNIFDDYYFFSIRKSNPAIKKIMDTKKACVCLIPFNKKSEVYALGNHHKDGKLDFNATGFNIFRSDEFKIPVPEFVININELAIIENFNLGMYTVFYARSVKLKTYSDQEALAHTPWYNLK